MLRAEGFDIKTNILLYKYCIEPYVTRTINYVYTSLGNCFIFSLSLVGCESYICIMFAWIYLFFYFINVWFAWLTCCAAFCRFSNGSDERFRNNRNLFSRGCGSFFFCCGDGA